MRILCLSTVQPSKGQEDLVLALSLLKGEIKSKIKCYIVGTLADKKYFEKIQKLIKENGLENIVKVTGRVAREKALKMMRKSDIVVLCSRSEALSRALIEAMKLGKAVIATRSGGNPEVISEGETGLLYEPANYEELAQKISILTERLDLRDILGKKAQIFALQRFNEQRVCNQLIPPLKKLFNTPLRSG